MIGVAVPSGANLCGKGTRLYNEQAQSTDGFNVGDVLRLSCIPETARVASADGRYVRVEWPWARIDPEATRSRWNGTKAFPRDPDHFEWRNTPWRIVPAVQELQQGDVCTVEIPLVQVRVRDVRRHDQPAQLGWLPRPDLALGVVFLGDEDEPEAGFGLHLPSREPIVVEHVDSRFL